jgi:hypothetical protein
MNDEAIAEQRKSTHCPLRMLTLVIRVELLVFSYAVDADPSFSSCGQPRCCLSV